MELLPSVNRDLTEDKRLEAAMPDIDSLAFDIRFALKHKAVGATARKLVWGGPRKFLVLIAATPFRWSLIRRPGCSASVWL
jgi:hypothetical protein